MATLLYIILISLAILQTCTGFLHFSSESSRVSIDDTSKLNAIGSGSFSVSLFFQGDFGTNYVARALLSNRKHVAYEAFMVAFYGTWSVYSGYRPFIQLLYNYISYSSEEVYTNGNWQHLVITRYNNVATNECELNYYINATRIYTTDANGCSASIASEGVLYIGYDIGTTGWIGNISEISIWLKALTQSEIQKIYNYIALEKTSLSLTYLLHYYPLDESYADCKNDGIIYDVWNNYNGVLSSAEDPICIDNESATFFQQNRTYESIGRNPTNTNESFGIYIILIVAACILLVCAFMIVYYHNVDPKEDEKQEAVGSVHNTKTEVIAVAYNNDNPWQQTGEDAPPSYFEATVNDNDQTTAGQDFESENIVPSAPPGDNNAVEEHQKAATSQACVTSDNMEGEKEGVKDKNVDVKQWFDGIQNLNDEDKDIYFDLFVENGFDKLNIVKDINDDDLMQIGINKLGHRKVINVAVSNLEY